MPAPSQHFTNLVSSHANLVATYLPNLSAVGIPVPQELELARAFVALAHAELEFYFESICDEMIYFAETEFAAGRTTAAALGIITFSGLDALKGGDQILPNAKGSLRKISERFYAALAAYRKTIAGNNGIRQKYLGPLFVPLGLTQEVIDPTWVVAIDAFADKRGAIAHRSMTDHSALPTKFNPQDMAADVMRIIFDDPRTTAQGVISSVESFDSWAMNIISGSNVNFIGATRRHSSGIKRALWTLVRWVDRFEIFLANR
jgi:hypothetical protein